MFGFPCQIATMMTMLFWEVIPIENDMYVNELYLCSTFQLGERSERYACHSSKNEYLS